MNALKRASYFGILFVLILGSLSHFVYGWSQQSPLAAPFFPINESTWEHMKLLYFPMLLYSICLLKKFHLDFPCLLYAVPASVLTGTFLIPVLFYTYTGILGFHTLFLDLVVFLLSVLAAFFFLLRHSETCDSRNPLPVWILCILTGIAFLIFSYISFDLGIFQSPV